MKATSSRKALEGVVFCLLTLFLLPLSLYFLEVSDEEVAKDSDNYCMPVVSSAVISIAYLQPEALTFDKPVVEVAAVNRDTTLSRGERSPNNVVRGMASYYGGRDGLDGQPTASGEIFNASQFTAAHRTLPFNTRVKVTFLQTGKSVVVRINDRGPFTGGRIIDLSRGAAAEIGLLSYGVGQVEIEVLP